MSFDWKAHAECYHGVPDCECARRKAEMIAEGERLKGWVEGQANELDEMSAENARLRQILEWLDHRGGLGLDVHDRIRAALSGEAKP